MPIQQIIKAVNEELKQSVEIIYLPNTPDAHGQFATQETLREACKNFNENLEKGSISPNLYHSKDENDIAKSTEDFSIMKTWINEVDSVIGDTAVPAGAWLASLQWSNDKSWELRKSGVLAGVSFGGRGKVIKPEDRKE